MCFIKKAFNKSLKRYDELPYLKYFRYTDFKGLKAKPYSFKSQENTLRGNFYFYDGYDDSVIVIFCHGISGGHSAYLHEIEMLCKAGFMVLAYDNTGCIDSDGKNIGGFAASIKDLDNAIISLKKNDEYKNKKIYVMGHSWGGFAASNIYNFQQVDKMVAVSPFISIKQMYNDFFHCFSKLLIPRVLQLESKSIGKKYIKSTAVNALNNAFGKALVIHSKDDTVVKYKTTTAVLQKKIISPNVEFYILDNKDHHPLFTKEAVDYYNETFSVFTKLIQEKKINTLEEKKDYFAKINFEKLVIQDKEVWKKVIEFLKN